MKESLTWGSPFQIMAAEEEMFPATREMKVEEENTYVAVRGICLVVTEREKMLKRNNTVKSSKEEMMMNVF